jgi:hypothetical protein
MRIVSRAHGLTHLFGVEPDLGEYHPGQGGELRGAEQGIVEKTFGKKMGDADQ